LSACVSMRLLSDVLKDWPYPQSIEFEVGVELLDSFNNMLDALFDLVVHDVVVVTQLLARLDVVFGRS
jgi:hypothetical protein